MMSVNGISKPGAGPRWFQLFFFASRRPSGPIRIFVGFPEFSRLTVGPVFALIESFSGDPLWSFRKAYKHPFGPYRALPGIVFFWGGGHRRGLYSCLTCLDFLLNFENGYCVPDFAPSPTSIAERSPIPGRLILAFREHRYSAVDRDVPGQKRSICKLHMGPKKPALLTYCVMIWRPNLSSDLASDLVSDLVTDLASDFGAAGF